MRLIKLENYDLETMTIARPVYDQNQRVALGAGATMTPNIKERLKEMKITYLFVEDAISSGITMNDSMEVPEWLECVTMMNDVFQQLEKNGKLNIVLVQKVANKIVDTVLEKKVITRMPETMVNEKLQLSIHSVNVAIMSGTVSNELKMNAIQIKNVIMGALLHDVGKLIAGKEDHTTKGFNLLRRESEINLLSSTCALRHHENLSGTYSSGQAAMQFSQIVSMINTYENFIEIHGYRAADELLKLAYDQFDAEPIQAFSQVVPVYPMGTMVQLSDGREAIVTKLSKDMRRPFVRFLDTKESVCLSETSLSIKEVL